VKDLHLINEKTKTQSSSLGISHKVGKTKPENCLSRKTLWPKEEKKGIISMFAYDGVSQAKEETAASTGERGPCRKVSDGIVKKEPIRIKKTTSC